jgi:hypothetical protein
MRCAPTAWSTLPSDCGGTAFDLEQETWLPTRVLGRFEERGGNGFSAHTHLLKQVLGRLAYVNGDFRQQLRAWLADNLRGEFAMMILLEITGDPAEKLAAELPQVGTKMGLTLSVSAPTPAAGQVPGTDPPLAGNSLTDLLTARLG